MRQLRRLYQLISGLSPLDKALILMWLDEKPYDEIAELSGLSRGNVATRLRRIKQKLIDRNSAEL
ncbi:MAG: sigma-70 region 4 domain-containing protein [Duncaniella sp.]|nr:sigma-70 region 4 domain-containing protein [Duncaniella sp.]